MTNERFTIEIVDDENWLIEDNETGLDYNPIDGTSKVLKGLINLLNEYYEENKQLVTKCHDLEEENEQLKHQIQSSIEMLKTEKELAISKNERIRLDFAITVLEELKGDDVND